MGDGCWGVGREHWGTGEYPGLEEVMMATYGVVCGGASFHLAESLRKSVHLELLYVTRTGLALVRPGLGIWRCPPIPWCLSASLCLPA